MRHYFLALSFLRFVAVAVVPPFFLLLPSFVNDIERLQAQKRHELNNFAVG